MFHRKRDKTRFILDWFTISYRDIWTAVGILALLVVAALAIWYYVFYESPPAVRALEAIGQAERALNRATLVAEGKPHLREGLDNARQELSRAEEHYRKKLYDEAAARAASSQGMSDSIVHQAEGGPGVARIIEPYGSIEVKRAHSPRWQPAVEGLDLFVGDQVRTGPGSSASIRYRNGTSVQLEPNAIVDIVESTQTLIELKLPQGGMTLETVENTETRIRTPQADARVEGADKLRAVVDPARGTAEFSSAGGHTTLDVGGQETPLGPNEGRVVNSSGGQSSFLWLRPPQLLDPADGRVFALRDRSVEKIQLVWSAVPGAARYLVEIMEAGRGGQRTSQAVEGTTADLEGPPLGSYLWRVMSQDKDGRSSFPTERRRFRVRDAREELGAPPKLVVKRFPMRFGRQVLLEGRTDPGTVLTYSVNGEREKTIASKEDGTFKEFVTLTLVGRNEIVVRAQSPTGAETLDRIPVDYEGS